MKIVTKIALLACCASMMFAGVNLTWGHSYAEGDDGSLGATDNFGIAFDLNDMTSLGWSDANGMTVGLDGPADLTMRLGFDNATSLGVSRSWWSSTGAGWGTSLNTSVDFTLTSYTDNGPDGIAGNVDDVTTPAGDFKIGVNFGFGF